MLDTFLHYTFFPLFGDLQGDKKITDSCFKCTIIILYLNRPKMVVGIITNSGVWVKHGIPTEFRDARISNIVDDQGLIKYFQGDLRRV